jgi:diguanylate cyclase
LVGDKVIKFVASALTESVKGKDLVARYGGEEFCVLLEDASAENALTVAEQIRKKIEISKMSRSDSGEELRPVTVSIGVSGAMRWDTAESLIEKADKALYQSKDDGRNRVTVSTEH